METCRDMPETLEELLGLAQHLEREWWRLYGALNALAQLHVERPSVDLGGLRKLQARAREVDRRRVELSVRIAEREGQG